MPLFTTQLLSIHCTLGRSLINAVAELDGKVVINTGAGADIITGSASANFGDSITSGAGNDTLKFAYDGLTSADTVAAGAGTDTLEITSAGAVADSAFTSITGIETVTTTADTRMTGLTLGSNAAAAGVTTITFADGVLMTLSPLVLVSLTT